MDGSELESAWPISNGRLLITCMTAVMGNVNAVCHHSGFSRDNVNPVEFFLVK